MMTQDSLIYKHRTLDPIDPKDIGTRQATDDDYKQLTKQYKDQYNRGHLNPSSHHAGKRGRAVLRGLSCVLCTVRCTRVFSHVGDRTRSQEHEPENTGKKKTLNTRPLKIITFCL